jgi:hypothetical protein
MDDSEESDESEDEDEGTDFEDNWENTEEDESEEDGESEEDEYEEDTDMELGALEEAVNVATRAITPLATTPRNHRYNHHNTAQKAIAAVTPIADAYGQPADIIIRKVDARLMSNGYPPGTAANLFAALSDLNDTLEQSARDLIAKLPTAEAAVLRQLSNIAQKLPRCHPTRTRAHLNIVRHRG